MKNKIHYVGASRIIRHYLPMVMYFIATLPILKVTLMMVMSSPTYLTLHPLEVLNAIAFLLACVIIGVVCAAFNSSCEFKELLREEERRTMKYSRQLKEIQELNNKQSTSSSSDVTPTEVDKTEEEEKVETPAPKKRYKKRRGNKKHY